MREVSVNEIKTAIVELIKDANCCLDIETLNALHKAKEKEELASARDILDILIKNASLAAEKRKPLCQDTGLGIFFIEIGQEVAVTDGSIEEIINNAMSETYINEPYRLSTVQDPYFGRINSNDNLPPITHWKVVNGDRINITFMPKGGGAENMSRIKMFTPLSDIKEIKSFIIDTVKTAGGKPCPPIIVGVGIGGNFDYAALLAKKSLLRPISSTNQDEKWASVERELFEEINRLNIGPMGLGGRTTTLGVNILTAPCHISSLPVAVNLQCHSHRHKSIII